MARMLDRDSPTPLHLQLDEVIKDRIANEEWAPNAQIPSETELGAIYGLHRMTVRNVITRLAQQGLVNRVAGKGTFVAEPKIANRANLPAGIQRQLDDMGLQSDIELLSFSREAAPGRVRRELQLEPGEMVYRIERLRTVGNEPLSVHLSFVPVSLCPRMATKSLEAAQLRDVLASEYDLRPARVVESIEAVLASDRDGQLLQVKPGFTLLKLEETNYEGS